MADEIGININLTCVKGNIDIRRNVAMTMTMAGTHFSWLPQTVGTTHEAMEIATDVATKGVAFFRNLDATNYIQIGVEVSSTFYPLLRLKAGEIGCIRLDPGATLFAKANSAPANLEHLIIED